MWNQLTFALNSRY